MQSSTKAIHEYAVRIAIAQALGATTLYFALIGGVMYQVATAAGYIG